MRAHTVARAERRIACFLDEGRASLTPVLALHGGPGFTHHYLAPGFAGGLNRTAIYFDWVGCGASSRHPGSSYPLEDYVADVSDILASLTLPRVVLMAHAWGAIPAVEHALVNPEQVAAIVLVNPLRILRPDGQNHDAQARMIESIDPGISQSYRTEVLPHLERALGGDKVAWLDVDASPWWARMWRTQFHRPVPNEWWMRIGRTEWGLESYFAHKGGAFMNKSALDRSYDLALRGAALKMPVLVLGSPSEANYVTPLAVHARPVVEALVQGIYRELPGTGHFPWVEAAAELTAHVSEFLEQHSV